MLEVLVGRILIEELKGGEAKQEGEKKSDARRR